MSWQHPYYLSLGSYACDFDTWYGGSKLAIQIDGRPIQNSEIIRPKQVLLYYGSGRHCSQNRTKGLHMQQRPPRCVCTHPMAALCMKWRGRHLESVTSTRKSESVNRCVFTWRAFRTNFTRIRFETTEPRQGFSKTVVPTTRTIRWVAIWDQFWQFLFQKLLKFEKDVCFNF